MSGVKKILLIIVLTATTTFAQPAAEINRAALDSAVMTQVERIFTDTLGIASRVARATDDPGMRELTVRMKIRASEMIDLVTRESDPRQRFVLLWTYAVQFRLFVTGDAQNPPFGDQQATMTQFAEQMVQRVEAIGHEFFSAEQINAARDEIEQIADPSRAGSFLMHPVTAVRADEVRKRADLGAILLRPITPLSSVSSGMTDAASAINRFSDVTASGINVAQRIPQRARWEMELLLIELDSLRSVADMLEQVRGIREDLRAATGTLDGLPQRTRLELEQSVKAISDALPQVRQTVEQLDAAVARAEQLAKTSDQTLGHMATAGREWTAAAREARAVMEQVQAIMPADAAESSSFDWQQVAQAAESVRLASAEMRTLLQEMQSAAPTQQVIGEAMTEARQAAADSVDLAAQRADQLVNKITWRVAAILAAFVFVQWLLRRSERRTT